MTETSVPAATDDGAERKRALSPEAQRALAEAEARKAKARVPGARPAEIGGRDGPDPVRFGDWEKAGLASDF